MRALGGVLFSVGAALRGRPNLFIMGAHGPGTPLHLFSFGHYLRYRVDLKERFRNAGWISNLLERKTWLSV